LFDGPLRGFAGRTILFYLDAHWNDDLPLEEELELIFSVHPHAVVMIDDFQVPDDPGYQFDEYGPGKALTPALITPVVSEFLGGFAERSFGNYALVASKTSHGNNVAEYFPYGAGMVVRRAALTSWLVQAEHSSITGRRGPELTSGEDLDMVLEALHSNWSIGYFPDLKLTHLIPGHRLRVDYLARLYHDGAKS
jgi:hypothetical protein